MTVQQLLAAPPTPDDYEWKIDKFRAARVLHDKDPKYDEWFFITQFNGGACQFSRGEKQPNGDIRYPEHRRVTKGGRILTM